MNRNKSSPLWLSATIAAIAFASLVASLHASELVDAPKSAQACRSFVIEANDGKTVGPLACRFHPADSDLQVTYSADKRAVLVRCPSPRRLPIVVTVSAAGKEAVELIDVEVTASGPVKPDVPKPTPTPKPIEPETPILSPFAAKVLEEANKIPVAGRAQQAAKIADSLKTVRSKIVAKGIDTTLPVTVVQAISEQTGKQPAAWSAWVKWWNMAGRQEFQRSQKMTPGNWIDLLDSTIEGLLAVK